MTSVDPELERVQALLEVGRIEEARTRLAGVLAAEPDNGRALCLLACCYHQAGDPASSLAVADRAVAVDPDYDWGHRLRASGLVALGRAEEAVAAAKAAVRLRPEHWAGHALVGVALAGTSRRAARAAFAAARRLAPSQPEVYVLEARVDHALGASWRARRGYRQALRLDPQNAAALEGLGAVALLEGRLSAAVRHVRSAVAAAPGSVTAVEYLDRTLLGMLGWAMVALFAVMVVLVFAAVPVMWAVAGGIVLAVVAWAWRVWRALPGGAAASVRDRVRRDPRMVVRVVILAVELAVAVGVGVSASRLDPDDPRVLLQLITIIGVIVLGGASVAAVDWWHARPRDLARISAARAGTPELVGTIDLHEENDATAKLLAFRWLQAALPPVVILFAPAVSEDPDRPLRARLGTILLAGYGLVAWWLVRRVRGASPDTIARWRRARALGTPIIAIAWLILVVFMVGASYLPDGSPLLVDFLAVWAFVVLLYAIGAHAVLLAVWAGRRGARLVRRGRGRRAVSEAPAPALGADDNPAGAADR